VRISFRFPESLASEATRARRRRSLLLAVTGIAALPLAWRGTSCGQDFDFHLQNWLEVARSWRHGVIDPHWAASANFLAGEPRFVFYPPLSRFLGAALGCVLPWSWTPLAFTLLCLLGAGWSLRAMAREWAGDDNAALAACLYVLNPYMLFVVYERGALAELLAAVWMPLLVLYGLRQPQSWRPLALTVAALWLTDAPAAVMGCYLLAGLVAVAAVRERRWRLVGRAAAAVALGLGLAAFWLIPAVYEQRWVQIGEAIGPLMRVEDSFLFGYVKAAAGLSADDLFALHYHNWVLRTASWIAVVLMLAAAVAAWRSWRRKSPVWLPLVAAGAAIAALQFRWSDAVWRTTPKLAFLQFPWRWMLVLGMIVASLVPLALRPEPPTRRAIAVRALVALLLAMGMAAVSSALFWQACDDEDNVAAQIETFHQTGFEGTDEYTLKGVDLDAEEGMAEGDETTGPVTVLTVADPFPAPEQEPQGESGSTGVRPEGEHARQVAATVRIQRWDSEHRTVRVTSPESGFAVLRLMDYPAWRVTRSGVNVTPLRRSDGWMAVPVGAGVQVLDIRWRTTGDQWAGIVVSLAALAVALAWGWIAARRPEPGAPRQLS
jgi:6-pyruvoyl-tetrahydropterin synthase related domain